MRDFDSAPTRNSAPAPDRLDVRATVKWFNEDKGFGFAALEDGSGDVFVHVSVVQQAGREGLGEGDRIVIDTARGQRGTQAVCIRSVTPGEAPQRRARREAPDGGGFRQPRPPRPPAGPALGTAEGTVKWFNGTKGFGFISTQNGTKDVFIHASALRRSGIETLPDGARVSVGLRQGEKGVEAATVALL